MRYSIRWVFPTLLAVAVCGGVACAGGASPSRGSATDHLPAPRDTSAILFRMALQVVADSADIPSLHVDPRALVHEPRDMTEEYLYDLSEDALAERRKIIRDLGFDTADAILAANCPGPFLALTVNGDTVFGPPDIPEELQRRCDARSGRYSVLIQEMPVRMESGEGWHVTVRITGASRSQTWAVTVPRDLSDAQVTLVEQW